MELSNALVTALPGKSLPASGNPVAAANPGAFAADLAVFMAGAAGATKLTSPIPGEALAGVASEGDATSESDASEGIADSLWAALGLMPVNPPPTAPIPALPGGFTNGSAADAEVGADASKAMPSAAATLATPADAALRNALVSVSVSAPGAESSLANAGLSGFNASILAAGSATTATTDVLPEALARAAPDVLAASATPQAPVAAFSLSMLDRLGATTAPTPAPAVVDPRLPQAPQQLAETLVWNIEKGVQQVQIHVHPADLGPINVNIRMDGDHVDVRFDAVDASVRDVVQTSLPQLASLLAARGLTLDQAQVFSQSRGGQQNPLPQPERREGDAGSGDSSFTPRRIVRHGLVDDYV